VGKVLEEIEFRRGSTSEVDTRNYIRQSKYEYLLRGAK
jgi:hypothetical protein